MSSQPLTRVIAFIAYAVMIVMNVLATTLPLNGIATNEISDKYDTLFAPSGFTFSIWGVIYTLLLVYTVYQLVRTSEIVTSITGWYIASSVLNSIWIVTWHYEILWLSLIVIVGMLFTLIRINAITTASRAGWVHTLAVRLPFAVYFGWITVATVANASAMLVQWGFEGGFLLSAGGWTVAILIVAAAIVSTVALINSSAVYALVLVWALWGILARHLSPEGWDQNYPGVILTLQILLPVVAAVALVALVRWLRSPVVAVESHPLWSRGRIKA